MARIKWCKLYEEYSLYHFILKGYVDYSCFSIKDSGILGSSKIKKKKHKPVAVDAMNRAIPLRKAAIALNILLIIVISSFHKFIG